MSAQQIHFAETIRAMKLALRRHADDSDSDDSIHAHTNRGNKLKRKAAFVRNGRLDNTGGIVYKKKSKHAGYARNVIYPNPILFDSEGEAHSPTSSGAEDANQRHASHSKYGRAASPLQANPYSDIHLEQLLRPLTNPGELPDHPSLSIPYKSAALTEMAEAAVEMVRRERRTLVKLKQLLVRFRGDVEWAPCGSFDPAESDEDERLLNGEATVETVPGSAVPSVATGESATGLDGIGVPLVEVRPATQHGPDSSERVPAPHLDSMEGIEAADMAAGTELPSVQDQHTVTNGNSKGSNVLKEDNQNESNTLGNPNVSDIRKSIEPAQSENTSTSNGPTHSMTTRRKARSPTPPNPNFSSPTHRHFAMSPTPSSTASTSRAQIHPWFTTPLPTLTDRDMGLPVKEAEDSRHLLNLYIQKSELMIRHLSNLAEHLLKADRMRKAVLQSCRASGHLKKEGTGDRWVTEMSDGEDWFDVQEADLQSWELKDGYLEKGKDEVEDVGAGVGGGEEEAARRGGRRRRVGRMG